MVRDVEFAKVEETLDLLRVLGGEVLDQRVDAIVQIREVEVVVLALGAQSSHHVFLKELPSEQLELAREL